MAGLTVSAEALVLRALAAAQGARNALLRAVELEWSTFAAEQFRQRVAEVSLLVKRAQLAAEALQDDLVRIEALL